MEKIKKNIWDNINFSDKKENTLKLLNKQAEELSDKTGGILLTEVNPIDAYEEQAFELGVIYNFYVYAPFLGNVRVLLFTVFERGKEMKLQIIDKVNNSAIVDIEDHDKLIDEIENIIKTVKVSEFLSNWYTASIEARK